MTTTGTASTATLLAGSSTPRPGVPLRLVVGLGNPGDRYRTTRHNLGFHVLETLAREQGLDWTEENRWRAGLTRRGPLWLLKPLTFMNLSGESVAPFARFHRIQPSEILVVLDDLALPVGRMRLRARGSDGGHNGLASLIQHLGTPALPRLRLGIGGPPPGMDPAAFVLAPPTAAEAPALAATIQEAAQTILTIFDKGLDAAMNHGNTLRFPFNT
jgi:PTH1 family peptidyl-tRNA hydrolase